MIKPGDTSQWVENLKHSEMTRLTDQNHEHVCVLQKTVVNLEQAAAASKPHNVTKKRWNQKYFLKGCTKKSQAILQQLGYRKL